jgi:hypothetical protein
MPFDTLDYHPWAEANLTAEQRGIWAELLAWLDTGGDDRQRFRYPTWYCGTHACIGGWLDVRVHGEATWEWGNVGTAAGLSVDCSFPMFFKGFDFDGMDPTAPIAASCVRHLLATGEIDWPRAFESA